MNGEPDWMVDQMLRRKREEIVGRWKEREERLAQIQASEKASEVRLSKRRRLEDPASKRKGRDVDEDAEFLLDDWQKGEEGDGGPMSVFSKETRALMEKVGLGVPKKHGGDGEEGVSQENEIKVYSSESADYRACCSLSLDLLHIKNSFPAVAVRLRASKAKVSLFRTSDRQR